MLIALSCTGVTCNGVSAVEAALKLSAEDTQAGDSFGQSIAVDSGLLVVGANGDDDAGGAAGAVYVFRQSGSRWQEEAKLTASDAAAEESFGHSVATDGEVVLIGAPGDGEHGFEAGAAYIFRRGAAGWAEEAKLTAKDASRAAEFGYSVDIDGDLAVIGVFRDDERGDLAGAAYVFRHAAGRWAQEAKLTASDGDRYDQLGHSVAISGSRVLAGADGRQGAQGGNMGAAYLFERRVDGWGEATRLTASDGAAEDEFGYSVALDGESAIVGAIGDDDRGEESGAAYVYRRAGSRWVEVTKLTDDGGAAGDEFGWAVAIRADRALVGAHFASEAFDSQGSATLFSRDTDWRRTRKLIAADGVSDDRFGHTVALDESGGAVVGVPAQSGSLGRSAGAVYLFP